MTWRLALLVAAVVSCGCLPHAAAPSQSQPTPRAPAASTDPEPWRNRVPETGTTRELAYPAPESYRLTNSLQILVVRQPVQIVALQAVVRHGASSVPDGKSGLAALTARMLTEGTLARSGEAIAVATEDLGSTLEADAGRDFSKLEMTVLPEDLDDAVRLLAEILREPAFDPREFARVRSEWLDGLVAERQSPERLATLAGLRLLLGPASGAPVGGSLSDVKRLTVTDVRDFYGTHYAPSQTAIVAVGDVTGEAVQAAVDAHFGTWNATSASSPPASRPEPTPTSRRIVIVDRPDAAQSALCAVQRLPPRSASGHEAREVLNTVLGGMFTSRLNRNLRERHQYSYGAGSAVLATRDWGAYLVMTTVEARFTRNAITEIVGELSAAAGTDRPITDREIDRAKAALVNAQAAHLESARDVASDTADLFVHDLPLDYYATYPMRIGRVTREAVLAEARAYLVPSHLGIVVVGPKSDIEPGLRSTEQTVETAHPVLLE